MQFARLGAFLLNDGAAVVVDAMMRGADSGGAVGHAGGPAGRGGVSGVGGVELCDRLYDRGGRRVAGAVSVKNPTAGGEKIPQDGE